MRSYGVSQQNNIQSPIESYVEEIQQQGFSIIPNILTAEECQTARAKLTSVYDQQIAEVDLSVLEEIGETNTVRCPLLYDEFFLSLATKPKILEIARALLGNYIILHLQNGVIVKPKVDHHQQSWHRDLPYQEFVISKPLAMGALFCLNDFSPLNGGTQVLPSSHKTISLPSSHYIERWKYDIVAPAGAVLLFDAMLYHKAGNNNSDHERMGINHVYVAPLLKQQINLPVALAGKYQDDKALNELLGYSSEVSNSVLEFRKRRLAKKNQSLY